MDPSDAMDTAEEVAQSLIGRPLERSTSVKQDAFASATLMCLMDPSDAMDTAEEVAQSLIGRPLERSTSVKQDAFAPATLMCLMDPSDAMDTTEEVAQSRIGRPLERSTMVQELIDHPLHILAMMQESLDARTRMLQEDPERFYALNAPTGRALYKQREKQNADTWTEASRSEIPTTACMRQLLDEVGMKSTGCKDTVRRRFKRKFTRDSVALFNRQWHILKVPKVFRESKANYDTWRFNVKTPNVIQMRLLLQQEGKNSVGLDQDIVKRFKCTFSKDDIVFRLGFWTVRTSGSLNANAESPKAKDGTRIQRAVALVHKVLYSSVNSQLDHTGASTHAEITQEGVTQIIETISTCFIPLLTKSEASAFRAIDLGAGYLTCLSHIAQVIPGEYVGIEYCPRRSSQFAHSYGALLAKHAEELCNTKIAYAHMDILDLHSYECDLVYAFDEAFPPAVWKKIVKTFVVSRRCKFLIMFKVAKASPGYKTMQKELLQAGLRCIHKLCLRKKGKESSNAMFFLKDKPVNQDLDRVLRSQDRPTDRFWEKCKAFWGSIEMAKTAVAELMATTDQQILTEKKQRKRNATLNQIGSDCGAAFMEECLLGCETCRTTFKHLSQNELYQAESEIDGKGLFTSIAIAKDRMILPFTGHKWKPNAATASDGYALQLDSQTWITPKGIPRFVNHSCEPNAAFMKWKSRTKSLMVSIVALEEIAKGAEVCVSYGAHHDLSTGRQACHCKAPSCVTHKRD